MTTIYLDHQASTPLDPEVFDAMLPWLTGGASNPHAAANRPGREAAAAVELAREHVAVLAGCDPQHVIFTSGATEAANQVIRSFGNRAMAVSAIEHPCVLDTARAIAQVGTPLSIIKVDDEGVIDLEDVERLLEGGLGLVAVMAVNNEIGTIQPFREIGSMARSCGVRYLCDAVQAAGRIPLSLLHDGVDYLLLSAHKIYGPQGVGALCSSGNALPELTPLITGGGQQGNLRSGTLPTALCVGFGAAARLARERMNVDMDHARSMSELMLQTLEQQLGHLTVNGSRDHRVPHNLNVSFAGIDADALLALMPNLAISTGSACSSGAIGHSHVLTAIGADDERATGAVRIGLGRRTTSEEVTSAASAIATAVRTLGGLRE